jgi:2-aminoadipate transaminase
MRSAGGMIDPSGTPNTTEIRPEVRPSVASSVGSSAGGLPAPDLLPVARIDEASQRVLARFGPRALQYAPTEGMAELRAVVAASIAVPKADVLITTGSQQGLDLVARGLLRPGDPVVVESPGYVGALQALAAAGADIRPVRTDADGLRADELESQLRAGLRPKLVYVVTDFQNPSGATLTLERRRHLAALADQFGFVIVEDDPYGELRFDGERIARLRELSDRVVSLGTASKTIAPGLRVAWTIAPQWLLPALVRVKQATDLHTSSLTQLIVADVLGDRPFLAGHLDTLRATYRRRSAALVEALHTELGPRLEFSDPRGGMFLWAEFTDGTETSALLPRAIEAGVAFVPGSAFTPHEPGDGPAHHHLRLCFTTLDERDLAGAARRLAEASRLVLT